MIYSLTRIRRIWSKEGVMVKAPQRIAVQLTYTYMQLNDNMKFEREESVVDVSITLIQMCRQGRN